MNPYSYYIPKFFPVPCFAQEIHPPLIKEHQSLGLGNKAPAFTLQGIVDGQPKSVSLRDYRGKWVVLFFYGSDFTFV